VWLEGLGQLKNPVTSLGIETATFVHFLIINYLTTLFKDIASTSRGVFMNVAEW
jgi:hypothetical protein